jgi:hypothetical protein
MCVYLTPPSTCPISVLTTVAASTGPSSGIGGGRKRKLNGADGSKEEAEAPPAKVQAKGKEEAPEAGVEAEEGAGASGGGSPKPQESERTKELLQRIQEVEEEKRQIEEGEYSAVVRGGLWSSRPGC